MMISHLQPDHNHYVMEKIKSNWFTSLESLITLIENKNATDDHASNIKIYNQRSTRRRWTSSTSDLDWIDLTCHWAQTVSISDPITLGLKEYEDIEYEQ